jgi:hypothetical protein
MPARRSFARPPDRKVYNIARALAQDKSSIRF